MFQVLPVDGQNDGSVESLLITKEEFETWVFRHRELDSEGLDPVAEDNRDLTGTYLMLDALGRFHNREGKHIYTESLLDVGVYKESIKQVGWDTEGFLIETDYMIGQQPIQCEKRMEIWLWCINKNCILDSLVSGPFAYNYIPPQFLAIHNSLLGFGMPLGYLFKYCW